MDGSKAEKINKAIKENQQLLKKFMQERYDHIEKYSCAFLKEVGSEEASKYELRCEQKDTAGGVEFIWKFELRSDYE